MRGTGHTILVTGGGTGIGRGFAEAFAKAGNTVVIAGRRRDVLDETVAANPGMTAHTLDVADAADVRRFAREVVEAHPDLDVLFNNAGMMKLEDLTADVVDLAACEATVETNLLGPMRLTAALLPHLRARPSATIVNVTSGLAYVPRATAPTYCATKAALRSYTLSLRRQLRDTGVEVIELAPPLVLTGIAPDQANNPRAMTLDAFVTECMGLMAHDAGAREILVERVRLHRNAEAEGRFDQTFDMING